FRTPLAEAGQGASEVIDTIARDAEDGLNRMSSPNFYGYVLGGSHPVGVAADMMVSAWGQNAGSAFETPAITAMERAVCDWTLDLLGLPADCGAGLVTGASVANMVAIMAARNALLAAQDWDVEAQGLFGAPEIPVLIGADAHSAPFAALRYAGFGAGRAIRVATDGQGRIEPADFAEALDRCDAPPLVVLQAGQINSGAFDPFAALIPVVRKKGGWVHVDGAFGLWLAAVPELAGRLAAVQDADSWAVDLHKWLNAPFDAGMVICRDRAPLVRSMTARGAYLPAPSDHWEPADSTPELSRRARGVPSYAILRHLGCGGVRELVARHCALAERAARKLAAEPGISVLNEIHSNQVAVTFGAGKEGDAQTRMVLEDVQRRGRVYPTHGEWRGRQIMRVSVICYATGQADIDLLVDEVTRAWRRVRGAEA
ncbi:MAG: aminotransferase class V-fold PLP-dependent enzyme, partial [Albidovulum sp.]